MTSKGAQLVLLVTALAVGILMPASPAHGQVFNYLDPIVDYSQSGTGSWIPVDVSADVPAGATGVMLHVKTETGTDYKWAVRKMGSTDTWMWGPDTIKNDTHTWFIVGVDSNRTFEVRQESNTTEIWLLGYTMPGATLFDNAIDMNVGTAGWEDVDIDPYTGGDTAIAGIFVIQNTNNSQGWSIRMNGAADNRGSHCPGGSAGGDLRTNMSTLAIVGVDGSEICEACIESTEIKVYLMGYVTEGAVFFQEPIEKTVATSYVDNDITSHIGTDSANGAFVQIWTDFDDRHQTAIRKNGATYDFDKWTSNQFAPVAVDGGNIFEFETDDTDGIEIWLYGYSLNDIANYRSIGTNSGVLYSTGVTSIALGSTTMTFGGGASLPSNVGVGDEVQVGGDTYYIKTKDSATQAMVHTASTSTHTNAAYSIRRAYNDIQVWENDRDGNLVGENRREVGVCYNDGEFAAGDIVIDGSTTDAGHYMTLTVAQGQRHNGIAGTGVCINGASASNEVFDPSDEYTVIEWLEIRNFDGMYTDAFDIDTDNILVQNLLIHDYPDASHAIGGDGDFTVRSCILYDGDEGIRAEGGTVVIENVTIYKMLTNGIDGRSGASGIEIRNCVVVDNNGTDIIIDCSVDYFGYNMYSSTSGFTPSNYAGNNQSPPANLDDLFVSISGGSENLHLEQAGHNALDTGLDLSSTFTTDIDGETRSGSWDLGADEMSATLAVNYRSIGTNGGVLYATGNASIASGSMTMTFAGGASLPSNVGVGDEISIGGDTFHIRTRNSATEVTMHAAATSTHSSAGFTIQRAYNDFGTWVNARDGDLVGDERCEVAVAYADGVFTPSSGISLDQGTCDATHYMKITAADVARHDGTAGTGVIIDPTHTDSVFGIDNDYMVVEWIEIRDFSGSWARGFHIEADNVTIQNVIIHDFDSGRDGIFIYTGFTDLAVRNTLIYDGKNGIYTESGSGPHTFENVTCWDMTTMGIECSNPGPISIANTVSVRNGGYDFRIYAPLSYFGYNMFETTSNFNPSSYQGNNQSPPADIDDLFVSIAAGSEDLHLEPAGHNALDTGLDLSSNFTIDIDGEARVPGAWDIGADEVGSGAGMAVNHRSIGIYVGTLYSTGNASISSGSKTMTFAGGASLPANVDVGDEITVGADTYYIATKDSATQVTVDTAAPSNHTNSAYSINRAYNDIQLWENARDGDLVGEDRCEVGVLYADGVFVVGGETVINGSTTDSTHTITLTVAEGQRHSGVAGTGVITDGGGDGAVIRILDEYVTVEWIEFRNFSGSWARAFIVEADYAVIQNVIIHDFQTGYQGVLLDGGANLTLRNSLIYDGFSGIYLESGSGATALENITMYSMAEKGVHTGGGPISVTNCIVVASADDDFVLYGAISYFGYNMYNGTYAFNPSSYQGNNQSPPGDLDDLFFSIAPGSENLHLEDGGHNAADTGLDLSSSFTTDIDDQTRIAPWDMGADQTSGTPLQMTSASSQTFTVGDPATLMSPITITDHTVTPVITAADDLRIKIPAGFNMVWDAFDVTATIGGTASGKVDTLVDYEDSDATLVLTVTADFAAGESVTVSDLSFTSFSAASSSDNLELDVTDGGASEATDGQTITIDAASPPPVSVSGTRLMAWREIEPVTTASGASSPPIQFDNMTPNSSSSSRSSASFTHTVGAACTCCTDSILVVITMTRGDQGTSLVEYDNVSLTPIANEQASTSENNEWVQIFYLVNPPSGPNTVDVTFGGNADPTAVVALSYFNVDSSDPIGAIATDSSTSSSSTVSVDIATTVANSVVVGGLGHHGGDTYQHAEGGDVTDERFDLRTGTATGSDSGIAGGEIATTGTAVYTFEWTGNASDDWAIACIELKPMD